MIRILTSHHTTLLWSIVNVSTQIHVKTLTFSRYLIIGDSLETSSFTSFNNRTGEDDLIHAGKFSTTRVWINHQCRSMWENEHKSVSTDHVSSKYTFDTNFRIKVRNEIWRVIPRTEIREQDYTARVNPHSSSKRKCTLFSNVKVISTFTDSQAVLIELSNTKVWLVWKCLILLSGRERNGLTLYWTPGD